MESKYQSECETFTVDIWKKRTKGNLPLDYQLYGSYNQQV